MKDRNAAFDTKEIAFENVKIYLHFPDPTEEKNKKRKTELQNAARQLLKPYGRKGII